MNVTVEDPGCWMFKTWKPGNYSNTQRMTENNPLNNLVVVDGFFVPLDSIPEDLQEMIKKERAEGIDIEFTTRPE